MSNPQVTIFNIGQNQQQMNAAMFREKFESKLFDPKLKSVEDTDTFIIRPVPFAKDPLNSMSSKNFYGFNDELGYFNFDSRTTFNRPQENHWEFCPPSDLWAKLRNSKDPNIQQRTSLLGMQRGNYCYVQVVAYPKDPTMNGKILPFRVPMEMMKAMDAMANPTKNDIALGAVPTQPFDIISGKNFKCKITGHILGNTLMRKWTVTVEDSAKELQLPLGPNGTMVAVSQAPQQQVIDYLVEAQTEDLRERYGYHEPTLEIKRRMKNYLLRIVQDIPSLKLVVDGYFPELNNAASVDQNANNSPTEMPAPQPVTPQPVAQPVTHSAAQPAPQAPAPVQDPTAAPAPEQPAAPAQANPTPAPGIVLP